jgi:hypothetical protein
LAVSDALTASFVELELHLPLSDGKTLSWLASHAEVLAKEYNEDKAIIHCRMPASAAGKLAGQGFELRVIAGRIPEPAKKGLPSTATYIAPNSGMESRNGSPSHEANPIDQDETPKSIPSVSPIELPGAADVA